MEPSLPYSRNTIITELWKNKSVRSWIKTKAPKGMEDDFKQEVFLVFCSLSDERLFELHEKGNLIGYAISTIKNIGNDLRIFNKHYFEKDTEEYVRHLERQEIDFDFTPASAAEKYLEDKSNGSEVDKHDQLIFKKYIELRSCQDVADFFRIPKYHAINTVKKIKKELQDVIKSAN
jgi:hypothetical protein